MAKIALLDELQHQLATRTGVQTIGLGVEPQIGGTVGSKHKQQLTSEDIGAKLLSRTKRDCTEPG